MNILITGAKGQLGLEIRALVSSYPNFEFIFADSLELDICNFSMVHQFVQKHAINSIINCAAYTGVDSAEEAAAVAKNVNSLGVENLVKAMQLVHGKLIQISTDYVFDGTNCKPYVESDPVNPLGVYGKTKLLGEQKVLEAAIDGIVIRTSWMYSPFQHNFVKTMLRLGEEKPTLNVVCDQVGTPTYAKDLAKICLEILTKNKRLDFKGKLYHYSNEGVTSWYDFAKEIIKLSAIECTINPIDTAAYPTLATRPFYSVLNKQKIKTAFGISIPYWRDSLKECLERIKLDKN